MASNLNSWITNSAIAFRGYNVTNLGRTPELLQHPTYGATIAKYLEQGSRICTQWTGRSVDLVRRVSEERETTLEDYAEAICLIVAAEHAQLELLRTFHGIDYQNARLCLGFSLGEISALVAGGVYAMSDALRIPLTMSDDCVELAHDVTMGVLFSRGEQLPLERVYEKCLRLNAEGQGVIGVSTYLSPNSVLLLGTQDTVLRFRSQLKDILPQRIHMRINEHRWPPLHTPIVWEKNICDRASVMLHTLPGGFVKPHPQVLSMVTGKFSYTETNSREIITQWIDHTQRLWDVVYELLQVGIETVVHVGPEPNIMPATFERLATNVDAQTRGRRRMRALTAVIRRPWLQNLLPRRAALLRAPLVRHVILENWLLDHEPKSA